MNRPAATLNRNLTKHVAIADAKAGRFQVVGHEPTYLAAHAATTYAIECNRNGYPMPLPNYWRSRIMEYVEVYFSRADGILRLDVTDVFQRKTLESALGFYGGVTHVFAFHADGSFAQLYGHCAGNRFDAQLEHIQATLKSA